MMDGVTAAVELNINVIVKIVKLILVVQLPCYHTFPDSVCLKVSVFLTLFNTHSVCTSLQCQLIRADVLWMQRCIWCEKI